jgi:hypothetical protein
MNNRIYPPVVILVCALLACNLPAMGTSQPPLAPSDVAGQPPVSGQASATTVPAAIPTVAIVHVLAPPANVNTGNPIFDVESSGTAAEKRAPYGDSYDINRLERPFLKDMTYVPDLDIETFSLSYDNDFYYLSIDLIGTDPNNPLGMQYGVELDLNADGFGDYIVLGLPPFSTDWTNTNVRVYADSDHDVSGLSAEKSDAPITTNGYEDLVFDGSVGTNTDPDLAWVRINFSDAANVQFSFKRSLAGSSFMFGAIADAGLKDVGKLDYVDRFSEAEAGSPVKDKKYYPLGALFAVDNTCREVFGFTPTGYEPQLCPRDQPNPTKKATNPPGTPGIFLFPLFPINTPIPPPP